MLEKFIFYFDRFHNNRKAEEKAKETLKTINSTYQKLHDEMKYDTSELQFLIDSGEFLIQARKNLKYTYVYGFFLDGEKQQKEKDLFEFNQAYFESNCEKLHELLEKKNTSEFFDNTKREMFYKYKQELIDITQATKKVIFFIKKFYQK